MILRIFCILALSASILRSEVDLDVQTFGESLGGWNKAGTTASYDLSGSTYRTYRPEITPTPDGGIFVSLRIDHRRGWLASDDHAVLEVAFAEDGSVVTAQSTLAIQGRTISSDLIRSSADTGAKFTGAEGAVKIGADLVADLSIKLLREKIVEAGRVSYPAALRHNYNLLFQAVRTRGGQANADAGESTEPGAGGEDKPRKAKAEDPLKIEPMGKVEKIE